MRRIRRGRKRRRVSFLGLIRGFGDEGVAGVPDARNWRVEIRETYPFFRV